MLRVGIVGSRRRAGLSDRYQVIDLVGRLVQENPTLLLVSGGCRKGADAFADECSRVYGVPIRLFLPDLSEGRRFPAEPYFKRNRLIAEQSDIIYAWVSDDRTGGTENTIGHALELRKPVYIVDSSGDVRPLSPDGRDISEPTMRLRSMRDPG